MTQQINIRIPDDVCDSLKNIISSKNITLGKLVAEAIDLYLNVEKNMDEKSHSRLVIENAKNMPSDYKLLLKY